MKKIIIISIFALFAAASSSNAQLVFQLELDPGVNVYDTDGTTLFNGFVAIGSFDNNLSTDWTQSFASLATEFNPVRAGFTTTTDWKPILSGTFSALLFSDGQALIEGQPTWDAANNGKNVFAVFSTAANFTSGVLIVDLTNTFADFTTILTIGGQSFTANSTFAPVVDTAVKATGLAGISAAPIPEPSTVALIALGLAGAVVLRRRRA